MHHSFVKPASAVALASLLTLVHAAVAPRQAAPSGGFTCTDDALYKGFFSNSQITYDVNTFCVSDLGLTATTVCDHSLTARTTVYPSGSSAILTVTATTTTYASTVTVIETGVVYDLSKKMEARNAAPAPALEAQITAAPKYVRDVLDARALEKRQSGFNGNSAALEVHSACECGYLAGSLDPGTSYYATCFPYTTTITADQLAYVPTTVFTTAAGPITTVTVTQNLTSNILSAISAMNTSASTAASNWTGSWTGSWTGPWNGSWAVWSGPLTVSPTSTSESVAAAPTMTSSRYTNTTTSTNSTAAVSSSVSITISPAMPSKTSSGRPTYPHSWNNTSSPTGKLNYTRSRPTGTGHSHTYNHTRSHNYNASTTGATYMMSTASYPNITTSVNSTSMASINSTSGASVGTISPLQTSNSAYSVSTITVVSTQYATLFNNATTTLAPSTTTIYEKHISTVTLTVTSTETVTVTTAATTTVVDTIVDTVAATTVVDVDTLTDTVTLLATAAARKPVPIRYGHIWQGAWRA